jgi:hypothetical protein
MRTPNMPETDRHLKSAKRVVVAMSGGVNSSVVAALMQEQGYDVIGVTLQLYDHAEATHRKGACCAGQDIQDARNVAARLGIPHFVLDYENQFQEKVIGDFAASYASGETPVPCIACNQFIKFADLFETAKDLAPRLASHRALYLCKRRRLWPPRPLSRQRCGARSKLFPFCHNARSVTDAAISTRRFYQISSSRNGEALWAKRCR